MNMQEFKIKIVNSKKDYYEQNSKLAHFKANFVQILSKNKRPW
jgi:hypothetical protein